MPVPSPSADYGNVAAPIGHYENFPVASVLCPPHLRPPIAAIYHFARTADDIADEGDLSAQARLDLLHRYRACLHTPGTGTEWPQVFNPLRQAMQDHKLPQPLLEDLLDAFEQDVEMTRDGACYADDAQLLNYCRRSANPVGRLLLHLYGVGDAQALARSDAICSALQLINFWQDLSVDIPRGRYYLSDAERARFGVPQADVLAQNQTPALTRLIASQVQSARTLMHGGAPLVHQVPGRMGWELRLVGCAGGAVACAVDVAAVSDNHPP